MSLSLKELLLLIALFSGLFPSLVAIARRRLGISWVAVVATFLGLALYFGALWQVIRIGPNEAALPWIHTYLLSGIPILLAGYLLSLTLGREGAWSSVWASWRTNVALLLFSVVFALAIKHPAFLAGYRWEAGVGEIFLGGLGKGYLCFLLISAVIIGYNLESTYRLGTPESRERLRPTILGLFGVLGFFTYVLTSALLYSSVTLDTLVASAVPVIIANVLLAYGYLRGSFVDATVPVSRNVVYSSFTAFIAAIYILGVGVMAQLATFTRWSPGQVVTVSLGFVVIAAALIMIFSNRQQRRVRRFIDRNFYVNRYDYRSQWFQMTRALDPSEGEAGVLRQAAALLKEVFRAEEATIALTDSNQKTLKVREGKGQDVLGLCLEESSRLATKLITDHRAQILDRNPEDFEYVPIYVEDDDWLQATASQIVAPLAIGNQLIGLIGLERSHPEDRFSFEDLDLLDNMSAQIAAVVRSVQLAGDLAQAREMELVSQWSSMLLHDMKNHLAPLRMIVQNMQLHHDNAQFREEAIKDIGNVADNIEALILRLHQLRERPDLDHRSIDFDALVKECVERLKVKSYSGITLDLDLNSALAVEGDREMLRRVLENLITNAIEAMEQHGTLRLASKSFKHVQEPRLLFSVSDSGSGMDEKFIRERLFRPFATTKSKGMGIGLYQCRIIVRAHRGDLAVQSVPNEGTTFELSLPGANASLPTPESESTPKDSMAMSQGRQP